MVCVLGSWWLAYWFLTLSMQAYLCYLNTFGHWPTTSNCGNTPHFSTASTLQTAVLGYVLSALKLSNIKSLIPWLMFLYWSKTTVSGFIMCSPTPIKSLTSSLNWLNKNPPPHATRTSTMQDKKKHSHFNDDEDDLTLQLDAFDFEEQLGST